MKRVLISCVCAAVLLSAIPFPAAWAAGVEVTLNEPANGAVVDSCTPTLTWTASGAKLYELVMWKKDGGKFVHHTYVVSRFYTVPENILEENTTYVWSIKGRINVTGPAITESPRWEFSVKGKPQVQATAEFVKTGNTLVIPVVFSDKTFESLDAWQGVQDFFNPWDTNDGKLRTVIKRKMEGLQEYYDVVARGSPDALQTSFDIAPVVKLKHSRKHYGDDKLKKGKYFWHAFSKENWRIDCGDFPDDHDGFGKLMQETLKELFKRNIPVTDYYHLMYLVPGSGGNTPGSNQIWPATYGPSPNRIKYRELDDEVTGYHCGIIMGLKKNTGTYCHEFGHEFGLPDLYPYPKSHPKRKLKSSCLMSAGNHKGEYGTGLSTLSQQKTFPSRGPEYKKDDWVEGRFEVMSASGTRYIYPRDSQGDLVGIAVPTGRDDYKYYIVECFDRKKLDKDIPALATPGQALASLNPFDSPGVFKCKAGVIVYKVDTLDVRKIKKAKLVGVTGATQKSWISRIPLVNKIFMDGGKIKSGRATIEIKEVKKSGKRYRARVKVTLK